MNLRRVSWDATPAPLRDNFGSPEAWERFSPRQAQQVLAGHSYALFFTWPKNWTFAPGLTTCPRAIWRIWQAIRSACMGS